MAKNKNDASTSLSRVCAYIGLIITAILIIVTFILQILDAKNGGLGRMLGVLNTIKMVAIALAIAIGAYEYASSKSASTKSPIWMIFFWIAVVIFFAFEVLNIGVSYWDWFN